MTEFKEKLLEAMIYSVFIMIISLFMASIILVYGSLSLKIISSVIGIIYIFVYIRKPYNKEKLLVNSWLCMVSVIFIGSLIGGLVPPNSFIIFGISLSFVEILSFTKKGTRTVNARIIANMNLTAKLIVYGKSLKNGKLIPTKGLGDYMFYSAILACL